jgi:hypothetical protein
LVEAVIRYFIFLFHLREAAALKESVSDRSRECVSIAALPESAFEVADDSILPIMNKLR